MRFCDQRRREMKKVKKEKNLFLFISLSLLFSCSLFLSLTQTLAASLAAQTLAQRRAIGLGALSARTKIQIQIKTLFCLIISSLSPPPSLEKKENSLSSLALAPTPPFFLSLSPAAPSPSAPKTCGESAAREEEEEYETCGGNNVERELTRTPAPAAAAGGA